jgi:hypothetical protein
MTQRLLTAWECRECEVLGRAAEDEPRCWNCGGPVVVTSRPTMRGDAMRQAVANG